MEKKSSEEMKERINADPNFVPRGTYYFEVCKVELIFIRASINDYVVAFQHDNREKSYNNRGRGGFVIRGVIGRGNYHQQNNHLPYQHQPNSGGYRGNYRGGGNNNQQQHREQQFRGGSTFRGSES